MGMRAGENRHHDFDLTYILVMCVCVRYIVRKKPFNASEIPVNSLRPLRECMLCVRVTAVACYFINKLASFITKFSSIAH